MTGTQTICDVCGAQKGETNHWFVTFRDSETFHAARLPGDAPIRVGASAFIAENEKLAQFDVFHDICGEHCLAVELSRWVAAGKEAPAQTQLG